MTLTLSQQKRHEVEDSVIENWGTNRYLHQIVKQFDGSAGAFTMNSISDLTVITSAGGTDAGESPSLTSVSVFVNIVRGVGPLYHEHQAVQDLNGNYVAELGRKASGQLRDAIEKNLLTYLGETMATGTAYTFNTAQDSVTQADFLSAIAKLEVPGVTRDQMVIVVDPFAYAALENAAGVLQPVQGDGNIGVPVLSRLNGVPVIPSSLLPGSSANPIVFTGCSAIAGLIQLSASHGFKVGMKLTTSGFSSGNQLTASAITAETATSLTTPTALAGAENGTVTAEYVDNLVIVLPQVGYGAVSLSPRVAVFEDSAKLQQRLRVETTFGRDAFTGSSARVISSKNVI